MCVCVYLKMAALLEPCTCKSKIALTKPFLSFLPFMCLFFLVTLFSLATILYMHGYAYATHFSMSHLRVQVSEDIHSGFLHHGEQIWVIISPFHIPDILALKFRWVSGSGPAFCIP